jgi:hypothetical protein
LFSLHRQLNLYGWTKRGQFGFENPVFFRGLNPKYFDLIRRKGKSNYIPPSQIKKMMVQNGDYNKSQRQQRSHVGATTSGSDDDNDDSDNNYNEDDETGGQNTSFPRKVWLMVESLHQSQPDLIRWAERGQAFYLDKKHPKLNKILKKYLHCELFWQSGLLCYHSRFFDIFIIFVVISSILAWVYPHTNCIVRSHFSFLSLGVCCSVDHCVSCFFSLIP